jgi:DNA-binding PadR family transcriptional regulator
MTPVFKHGDLRLYLLGALEDEARHGYELITLLEARLLGLYRPSAGTIYPRLAALEEEGLVSHRRDSGRKVFALTAAGRAELEARRDELRDLQQELAGSTRGALRDVRTELKASVRQIREGVRAAMAEVRDQERRVERETTARRSAAGSGDEHRRAVRALQVELGAFAADVTAAARRYPAFTSEDLAQVTAALDDARTEVLAALSGVSAD